MSEIELDMISHARVCDMQVCIFMKGQYQHCGDDNTISYREYYILERS